MSWYDPRDWSLDDLTGNRAGNAEDMYGGVDRNNFNVPGFEQSSNQYNKLAGQYGGRQAPQAEYSDFRRQQQGLGGQLGREMRGNGIGANLIRNQARDQSLMNQRQQMSMAASARPGQSALASRQAMMNAGNANAQVGGQSANAIGQHQLGAMQNYGQFLQGARGADESLALGNVDARLRQLGMNDQSQLEALRQRLQLQGMQQQGGMGYENQRTARYGALMGAPTSQEQALGFLSGNLKAGMSMAGG